MGVVKTWVVQNRFEILRSLEGKLRTGDIAVRLSDTKGPFGIPFSKWVADMTGSPWSHASVIFIREVHGKKVPYTVEISDRGTIEYRLLDWLDFCVGHSFAIYRVEGLTSEQESLLYDVCHEVLDEDVNYDFTYSNPSELYCVESVYKIFERIGVKLDGAALIPDVLSGWRYQVFKLANWLFKKLTKKGFDTSIPMYFVGTDKQGLLSAAVKLVAQY